MTDRPDEPLSSEELIRRAREGFTTPEADDVRPSRRPEEPERDDPAPLASDPVIDEPPAPAFDDYRPEPEPTWTPPIEDEFERQVEEPPAPSPFIDDPIDSPTAEVEDDESLLPDHFKPEAGAPAGGRARPRVRAGWLVAAAVGGFALFSVITADTAVEDLSVGDCFLEPNADEISTVETVDCSEPHEYEVFAFVGLNDRPGGFPGDNPLFDEAYEKCFGPFVAYLGGSFEETNYLFDVFIPGESSWDAGDRESMCAVVAVDDNLNIVSTSGSARGN